MKQADCFELGSIVRTHGLKGEMIWTLDVDEPEDYAETNRIFIEIKGGLVAFEMENLNILNDRSIARLKDITHIDQAKALVGCKLFLPLDELPELDDDQFYYHDIIGYTVEDEKLGKLGEITDFYEFPQHDVLEMIYQGKTVLIPVADEVVLEADREKKILYTSLPEGLVDIYLNPSAQDDGLD
jgi:16S rRNA processing protein RimM